MTDEQSTLQEQTAFQSNNARVTSRLAALRAAPRSGSTRRMVLAALVLATNSESRRGLTDDETSRVVNLSPNTVRPRRLELVEGFWVIDSGLRRPSDFGNPAIVWAATPKAIALIKGEQ